MHKKIWLFIGILFIGLVPMQAQKSAVYTHDFEDYDRALALFKESQYQSAQILFDKILFDNKNPEINADCAYYSANCAIRLNQQSADEQMENFVKNYPTSPKQNQAYVEVGQYYFEQGRFPQALEWFDKSDENSLSYEDLEKFKFQKGYCYFSAGKKKEATHETPKDDPEAEKKEPEAESKEPVTKKKLSKSAKKTVKIPAVKFFSGSFPQYEEARNPIIRKTFGIEETMRRIRAFKKSGK